MKVLLFFIDGLGVGPPDPKANPLVVASMPAMRSLLGGAPLASGSLPRHTTERAAVLTDACLDVPGLPQSATGQTSIFTGKNGAQAIGRHLNYYPTPTLRSILNQDSIFKQVAQTGRTVTFLNAFRPQFFDWVAAGQPPNPDRRFRPSASTVAGLAAGVSTFRSLDQLRAGQAVGFDIDHHLMRTRGYDLSPVAPEEAGRRAARVAADHHFTLYEHFLTDTAGHSRSMEAAVVALERVDRFLAGLLANRDPDQLLIITSDHGNVEDLSVKTHTRNPVPTILVGPGAEHGATQIRSLTDITPTILSLMEHSKR